LQGDDVVFDEDFAKQFSQDLLLKSSDTLSG
jgi:hypothetical protein